MRVLDAELLERREPEEGRETELMTKDGVIRDVFVSFDDWDERPGADKVGGVDGGAGDSVEREMAQVGDGGSNGNDEPLAPTRADSRQSTGTVSRSEGGMEHAQREAGLIAAVINAQGLEGSEFSEARDHRLCQRRREAERELLHLGAVGKEVEQCIRHAHRLGSAGRFELRALGADGELAGVPVILFRYHGSILVERFRTAEVDGLKQCEGGVGGW